MLPKVTFTQLMQEHLQSRFQVIEKISELAHFLFDDTDPSQLLEELYGMFCGGELGQLKQLFFEAFDEESGNSQHQQQILDYLWALPIDRNVKLEWMAELLKDLSVDEVDETVEQIVHPDPQDPETVNAAQELANALSVRITERRVH